MHYSGILVLFAEDAFRTGLDCVERIDGISVEFVYPESRRAIVVLETETLEQQKDGLRSIQAISHVTVAEFAYHRIEEDMAADAVTEFTQRAGRRLEVVESRSSYES